jgi:hypothetical protein
VFGAAGYASWTDYRHKQVRTWNQKPRPVLSVTLYAKTLGTTAVWKPYLAVALIIRFSV